MNHPKIKIVASAHPTDWDREREEGGCSLYEVSVKTVIYVGFKTGCYHMCWKRKLQEKQEDLEFINKKHPRLVPNKGKLENITQGKVLRELKRLLNDMERVKVVMIDQKDTVLSKYPMKQEYGLDCSTYEQHEEDRRILMKNIDSLRGLLMLISNVVICS